MLVLEVEFPQVGSIGLLAITRASRFGRTWLVLKNMFGLIFLACNGGSNDGHEIDWHNNFGDQHSTDKGCWTVLGSRQQNLPPYQRPRR